MFPTTLIKSHGFSLVESLMIMGVLTIGILGATQVMSLVQSINQSSQGQMDVIQLDSLIRLLLSNRGSCEASLKGKTVNPTELIQNQNVIIELKKQLTSPPSVREDMKFGGIQVRSLKLKFDSPLGTNLYLAKLKLETQSLKKIFGKPSKNSEYNLTISTELSGTDTVIKSCSSIDSAGGAGSSVGEGASCDWDGWNVWPDGGGAENCANGRLVERKKNISNPGSCQTAHAKGYRGELTVLETGQATVNCYTANEHHGEFLGQFKTFETDTSRSSCQVNKDANSGAWTITTTGKQNNQNNPKWTTLNCTAGSYSFQ